MLGKELDGRLDEAGHCFKWSDIKLVKNVSLGCLRERNEEAQLVVSDFREVHALSGARSGPAIPPLGFGSTSGDPPHVVYLEFRGFLGCQGPHFVSRCLACLRSETEGRFGFDD